MNREIKFRAWILSPKEYWTGADNFETFDWNNRMRTVSSIHFPLLKFSGKDITCESICEDDNYASGWHGASYKDISSLPNEIEYDLMQFVNSKDRNGIEVYEGDILEAPSGLLFVVKWNDEEMRWSMYAKNTWYNMNMGLHTVIGNIYENPELLESVA